MSEFPALPLWTDAYLGDTTHLTTIEHGAYLLLLMAMWRTSDCSLPHDDKLLARYARLTSGQWARVKQVLMPFFRIHGDRITQGRLTDEREAVRQRSHKQSDKAKARWLKNNNTDNAVAKPDECQTDASHTHTHTHKEFPPIAPPSGGPTENPSKRGTRIPDDFCPDRDFAAKAGLSGAEIDTQVASFLDWAHAAPGAKGVKLDWQATWRNWVRRSLELRPAWKKPQATDSPADDNQARREMRELQGVRKANEERLRNERLTKWTKQTEAA